MKFVPTFQLGVEDVHPKCGQIGGARRNELALGGVVWNRIVSYLGILVLVHKSYRNWSRLYWGDWLTRYLLILSSHGLYPLVLLFLEGHLIPSSGTRFLVVEMGGLGVSRSTRITKVLQTCTTLSNVLWYRPKSIYVYSIIYILTFYIWCDQKCNNHIVNIHVKPATDVCAYAVQMCTYM